MYCEMITTVGSANIHLLIHHFLISWIMIRVLHKALEDLCISSWAVLILMSLNRIVTVSLFFFTFLLLAYSYLTLFISAVRQSESATCIHISPLLLISFPFKSPQSTQESFLCCIAGSHYLFILHITALSWQRGFHNSMKLWAMPSRATQDRQVIVKSSDKMWFTGEENGNTPQYSCLESPMNSMKRQQSMDRKKLATI